MSNPTLIDAIRQKLTAALAPSLLEIHDDSAAHAGHEGAKAGAHIRLRIQSPHFEGMKTLERHRAIYKVLEEEMKGTIHALVINL